MNTEEKLKTLFDFQRFANDSELDALIQETEDRYFKALTDEELELVSAAGEVKSSGCVDGLDKHGQVR